MRYRLRTLTQFRLGSLLLGVTLFGIWLGVRANIAKHQKIGVPEIQRCGGWVRYDFQMDSQRKPVPGAKSWVPQRILALTGLDFFHDVVEVNMVFDDSGPKRVDNSRTDFDLSKHIEDFPRLRRLVLKSTQASDQCLEAASHLPYLEQICCWNARNVTDAGTTHLRRLRRLTHIHITQSKITDESLRVFGAMPQLELLSLHQNHFTDRGLAYLRNLKHLKTLYVHHGTTEITDAGLAELASLQRLERLAIRQTTVTPEAVAKLKQAVPTLQTVELE
jgi:hypothetical protein